MFVRVCIAVVAVAGSVGAFATDARADWETTSVYWSGYASSGEWHSTGYDSACQPISGSAAEFSGPGFVTVALIDSSGTWRYAQRSQVHPVQVYVSPDTYASAASWTKKAYCKQSTAWQISFSMYCGKWYWIQDPVHIFCV
jgi:hypothetical protein